MQPPRCGPCLHVYVLHSLLFHPGTHVMIFSAYVFAPFHWCLHGIFPYAFYDEHRLYSDCYHSYQELLATAAQLKVYTLLVFDSQPASPQNVPLRCVRCASAAVYYGRLSESRGDRRVFCDPVA